MREEVAGDGIGASGPDSWVCLELWSSWGEGGLLSSLRYQVESRRRQETKIALGKQKLPHSRRGTDVPVGAAADGVYPRIQRVETKGPTVGVVIRCWPCFLSKK